MTTFPPVDVDLQMLEASGEPDPDVRPTQRFGWELVIDLGECGQLEITSKQSLLDWVVGLCAPEVLNMRRYGDPFLEEFGEGTLAGLTLLQPIYTSSIGIHCCPDPFYGNSAFVNIFSCRQFDKRLPLLYTIRHFKAQKWSATFLDRCSPIASGFIWPPPSTNDTPRGMIRVHPGGEGGEVHLSGSSTVTGEPGLATRAATEPGS